MMNLLPPMPSWESAHPVLVHLPIGVLFFAPVLLILAAIDAKRRRVWAGSALAAMLFGTLFAFLAVMSGEEAAEHVVVSAQVDAMIEHHEELGEAARTVFAILTGVFAAILIVGVSVKKKWMKPAVTVGSVLFGLGYLYGLGLLANAGHEGGRLVHEFGIRAPLTPDPNAWQPDSSEHYEDDDD